MIIETPIPTVRTIEPDWIKGSCTTDVATADLGFDTEYSPKGSKNRLAAKRMCWDCPIMRECGDWVIAAEGEDKGSLGGVYGGMDKWNRRGFDLQVSWSGALHEVPWTRPGS